MHIEQLRSKLKLNSILFLITILISINQVCSFYVPGVAPQDFRLGDPVEVKVKIEQKKNRC